MALIGTISSEGLHFRNRIINGDMRVAQRAVSANTSSAFNFFVHDRWQNGVNGHGGDSGARFTWTQSTDVPSDQGFKYSLKLNTITPDTTTGTNKYQIMRHVIEQQNIVDLNFSSAQAKTFTLSFWVKSSVTGVYVVNIQASASSRSRTVRYTINSADTWEYKTITVEGDTGGSGFLAGTDNSFGFLVDFVLSTGTTFNNTDDGGVWHASSETGKRYFGHTANFGFNLNEAWLLTGVQLEVGSVATPFERRPYGTELALCQRYYYKTQPAVTNTPLGVGFATSTSAAKVVTQFPVSMRTHPTALEQSGVASHYAIEFKATGSLCSSVPNYNKATTESASTVFTASGLTAGEGILGRNDSTAAFLAWSAEL